MLSVDAETLTLGLTPPKLAAPFDVVLLVVVVKVELLVVLVFVSVVVVVFVNPV